MTANQVRALEAQEARRSHQESERLTAEQNKLTERELQRKAARDTWEEREKQKENAIKQNSNMIAESRNRWEQEAAEHKTAQGWFTSIGKTIGTIGSVIGGLFA
jgi:hypothetical protein